MIFQHTLQQVLDGSKTQTSRIVKPGEYFHWEAMTATGKTSAYSRFHLPRLIKTGNKYHDLIDGSVKITSVTTLPRKNRKLHWSRPIKWRVGNTYAVQPGRGKKAVARIRILKIRQMDVREFTAEDVIQEGFDYIPDFLVVWCKMHDPHCMWPWRLSFVKAHRPAEHYTAWTINFELVK